MITEEYIERALVASLYLLLGLSIIDFLLYFFLKTAVLTVFSNIISFYLLLRYRLNIDIIKFIESLALFIDLYIILSFGYAIVSPIACLISILIISFKKEKHLNKLRTDVNKIISYPKKNK